MPNLKELDQQRDAAEAFLQSMAKMDLKLLEGNGMSVETGVDNCELEAITSIWMEGIMKDRNIRFSFFDHMDEYPKGYLARAIKYTADKWVAMGKVSKSKAYSDFGLVE